MFFQLVTTYIYRNWEVLFPRMGLNAQTGFFIATHVTADRKYENLQYLIQRHKKRTPVPSGSQKKNRSHCAIHSIWDIYSSTIAFRTGPSIVIISQMVWSSQLALADIRNLVISASPTWILQYLPTSELERIEYCTVRCTPSNITA